MGKAGSVRSPLYRGGALRYANLIPLRCDLTHRGSHMGLTLPYANLTTPPYADLTPRPYDYHVQSGGTAMTAKERRVALYIQ